MVALEACAARGAVLAPHPHTAGGRARPRGRRARAVPRERSAGGVSGRVQRLPPDGARPRGRARAGIAGTARTGVGRDGAPGGARNQEPAHADAARHAASATRAPRSAGRLRSRPRRERRPDSRRDRPARRDRAIVQPLRHRAGRARGSRGDRCRAGGARRDESREARRRAGPLARGRRRLTGVRDGAEHRDPGGPAERSGERAARGESRGGRLRFARRRCARPPHRAGQRAPASPPTSCRGFSNRTFPRARAGAGSASRSVAG